MTVDRGALEELPREDLVVEARRIGVVRPEVMTRVELVDEIVRTLTPNPVERKKARGWLGIARDLIASAVEQGLNLPDAAALIRGDIRFEPLRTPQSPVATVTLAEIYGAQGHLSRALGMLDEVLSKEPDHHLARALHERLNLERTEKKGDARRVVPDPPEEPSLSEDAPEAPTLLPSWDAPDAPTLLPSWDAPDAPTLLPSSWASDAPDGATLLPPSDAPDAATLPAPPRGMNGVPAATALGDALVLVHRGAASFVVYYERALGFVPEGASVIVRVVEMRPLPLGAERVERDFPLGDGASGTVTVEGMESNSVVRAALGIKLGPEFRALAVAVEVKVGGEGPEVVWAPRSGAASAALLRTAASKI